MVGLSDIIYSHIWYNLPPHLSYVELNKNSDKLQLLVSLKFGRGGYFDCPKELLEQLIPALRKYNPSIEASYNDIAKCIDFRGFGQFEIRTFSPLAYMLGLKANQWWTLCNCLTPHPCDLRTSIYNLYVYMDIIQYQAVGNSYSPLLGTVKVSGDFEDMVNIRHHMIHYLPVFKNYIKSIRIEIKMDRNRCVDFVYGKSIVKLHFKPAGLQSPL